MNKQPSSTPETLERLLAESVARVKLQNQLGTHQISKYIQEQTDPSMSRRKVDGQAQTEQSSQTSSPAIPESDYVFYSSGTTSFQNHLKQSTPTMPVKQDMNLPSEPESQKSGFCLPWDKQPKLPTDPKERKKIPLWSGLVKYFPDALAAVAAVSYRGNEQHNPGKPLHWDRSKSMDQEDTLLRHLWESGTVDTDGHRHSAKVAWRALALLQLEIEQASSLAGSGANANR